MNVSILLYALAVVLFLMLVLSRKYTKGQKVAASLILVSFLAVAHLALLTNSQFYRAFVTIIAFLLISIFLAGIDSKRLFVLLLSFAGARFLILYFQALGSLALTGTGLILSGIAIIGLAFLWHRYRHSLFTWSHELAS
jgi:hypothetical protein